MACVVCCSPGVVYCDNDKALLCKDCDVRIHTSNAVAARHVRRVPCEGGCGKGASLFCRSDNAYMCEACHSANPLASTHDVELNAPLSAIEQVPAIRGEVAVPGPCESVAQSASSPVDWFLDNDKKDITSDYGEGTILSPAGSEAVVPVISAAVDEFAFTTPTTFKDIKDKMDFESLELDKAWLDMGFDFTDILSDLPSDAGLVPDFDMELAASDIISDAVVPSLPEELPAIESSEPPQLSSLRSEEPTVDELPAVAQDSAQPLHNAFHLTHPASMYFQPVLPQQQFLPSAFASPPAPAPKAATAYNAALMSGANLTREQRVARYREKRKNRKFEKTIRYASRKAYAEIRPRIKGRFARKEEIEAWKAAHGGDDAVVPEVLDGF